MKQELKFSLMHLDNYVIVEEPCVLDVTCLSTLHYDVLYTQDGHDRWLVKLNTVTAPNLKVLKKIIKKNTSLGVDTYYSEITYLLSYGAIWETQIYTPEDLPVKGEKLWAAFDFVKGVLCCTHITVKTRKTPTLYKPALDIMQQLTELELIIEQNGKI